MERIKEVVSDMVRFKPTGQLLAVSKWPSGHGETYLVVDEQRRELVCWDCSSDWDYPKTAFVKRKSDLAKVRESKEKRELIAHLNRKIVWSNVSAVGSVLERISEMIIDFLPLDNCSIRVEVDRARLERCSPEIQALARIREFSQAAGELLSNAEELDARVLRRFALREPWNVDEAAGGKAA